MSAPVTENDIKTVQAELKKLKGFGIDPFTGLTQTSITSAVKVYELELGLREDNKNIAVTNKLVIKMREVVDQMEKLVFFVSNEDLIQAIHVLTFEVNSDLASETAIINALDSFVYRLKRSIVPHSVPKAKQLLSTVFSEHMLTYLSNHLQSFLVNHTLTLASTRNENAPFRKARLNGIKQMLRWLPIGTAGVLTKFLTMNLYAMVNDQNAGRVMMPTPFRNSLRNMGVTDVQQATQDSFVVGIVRFIGNPCILQRLFGFAMSSRWAQAVVVLILPKGVTFVVRYFTGLLWGPCKRMVSGFVSKKLGRPMPSSRTNVAQRLTTELGRRGLVKQKKQNAPKPPAKKARRGKATTPATATPRRMTTRTTRATIKKKS